MIFPCRLCTLVPTTTPTPKLLEELEMAAAASSSSESTDSKPLTFQDIIPDPKMYDKMKPPKLEGYPTKVSFHVTVMGLDSINEYSMVRKIHLSLHVLHAPFSVAKMTSNTTKRFFLYDDMMRIAFYTVLIEILFLAFLIFYSYLKTYAADIFFAQKWKDHRLRLPENMTAEYRYAPCIFMHCCCNLLTTYLIKYAILIIILSA